LVKLGHVSLELCEQTDRQVDRNTLHLSGGGRQKQKFTESCSNIVDTCHSLYLSTVAITDYATASEDKHI